MYWNGSFGKESVIRSPSSYYYAPQHIAATAAVAPRQVGSLVMCSIYLHKWSNQWIMSIWRCLIEGIGKTSWSTCKEIYTRPVSKVMNRCCKARWMGGVQLCLPKAAYLCLEWVKPWLIFCRNNEKRLTTSVQKRMIKYLNSISLTEIAENSFGLVHYHIWFDIAWEDQANLQAFRD